MQVLKPHNHYTLDDLAELTGHSKRQVRYLLEKHKVKAKSHNRYGDDALTALGGKTVTKIEVDLAQPDPVRRSIAALEALGEVSPEPARQRHEVLKQNLKSIGDTVPEAVLDEFRTKPQPYPVSIRLRPGITVQGHVSPANFDKLLDLMETE